VLGQPGSVDDQRAVRIKHTDTVFTMPDFADVEAWEAYAGLLRRQILLSSGLYPLPERTPLNAEVFDKVVHDDYSVEKVRFEAWPGFYVTGNLYRPVGEGPFPAVVGPHGHWEHGRLENSETGSVPARHITFARMGIVAFSYDMIGYNDSKQFKHAWAENRRSFGVCTRSRCNCGLRFARWILSVNFRVSTRQGLARPARRVAVHRHSA